MTLRIPGHLGSNVDSADYCLNTLLSAGSMSTQNVGTEYT